MPCEIVDAALAETGAVQFPVRVLPSRLVVYALLTNVLFAECGHRRVWRHLIAGLDGLPMASSSAARLAANRRRVGAAPLRALFDLLRNPGVGPVEDRIFCCLVRIPHLRGQYSPPCLRVLIYNAQRKRRTV